mgnify:CR=1 FL=1|tara:strand:+ start:447 stop:848 length:402 start_codon:yes stop_codon:yes gene_type:complete
MKKSELTNFIKEEIVSILEQEETAKDIKDKAKAQADLNKQLAQTAKIQKSMGMEENEEAPAGDKEVQKKASKQDKIVQKYQEYRKELKSYLKDYQESKDDSAKEKALQQMKKLSQSAEYLDAKEKYDKLAKVN